MAEVGNLVTPEYQAMLDNILSMYGKKKQQAEAGAIGETMRRGLVNEGGTSDIEGMLRSAAVTPIEEAQGSAVSNIYNQAAQQGAAERVNKENQAYGTSERLGSQTYGTQERLGSQDYNKMLQEYLSSQASTEAQKQRDYDLQSMNLQRGWATQDAAKQRKGWWKDALGGAAGTAAGIGLGSLFSDERLKENVKKVGSINIYEFTYKKDTGLNLPIGKQLGVMAQELEKIIPEAVSIKDGYKIVDYQKVYGRV